MEHAPPGTSEASRERAVWLVDEAIQTLAPSPEDAAWVQLLRLVRTALMAPGPDANGVLRMGHVLEEVGRYDLAADFFREAIRLEPASPLAWTHYGEICRRLERWDDAVAAYDEAVRAAPDYHWAHAGRGEALRMLGRAGEAAPAFERALKADPAHLLALQGLAATLSELGRHAEALPVWESALRLRPDSGFANDGLTRCHEAMARIREDEEATRPRPTSQT